MFFGWVSIMVASFFDFGLSKLQPTKFSCHQSPFLRVHISNNQQNSLKDKAMCEIDEV